MAAFPTLKTGAVAQYPSERSRRFLTTVFEFLDGSEQRFAQYGSSSRRWVIQLDRLDEKELFDLEQFFIEQGGAAGSFEFADPWDDAVYPNCSIENDDIELVFAGLGSGQAALVVKENR